MINLRKVIFLIYVIAMFFNYAFAQEGLSKKTEIKNNSKVNLISVSGKVIDRATSQPIAGAEITYQAGRINDVVSANLYGYFNFQLNNTLRLFGIVKVIVKATGYQTQTRYLLLWRNRTIKINFYMQDITQPVISIVNPMQNEEIISTPRIRLNYFDNESGINTASLKIAIGNQDLTAYITTVTSTEAICVIPQEAELPEGECTIVARISDFIGNNSEARVSVIVVDQANILLQSGKEALIARDFLSAHNYFLQALNISPNDAEANFYYSITRLAMIPSKEKVFQLLKDMGFTSQDGMPLSYDDVAPFNFRLKLAPGLPTFNLPVNFPSGNKIQEVIQNEIITEMEEAIQNLEETLADQEFTSYLELRNPITGSQKIEIDYADVAMLKSAIYAMESYLYELLINNLECDLSQMSSLFTVGTLTPEFVLNLYPQLLRVQNIPQSLKAKEKLVKAIDTYVVAYNALKIETDDQSDDLLSLALEPQHQEDAELFLSQVLDIKKSLLNKPDSRFSVAISQFINLGDWYEDPLDIRRFFDNDVVSYLLTNRYLRPVDYLLTNLSNIGNDFQEYLPPRNSLYTKPPKEVDFGDITLLKSNLEGLRTLILSISAYDLTTDYQSIILNIMRGKRVDINDLFNRYPSLLLLKNSSKLDLGREAFNRMINHSLDTLKFSLHNEDNYQADDLFIIPENIRQNESNYRMILTNLNAMQTTLVDPNPQTEADEFSVNLGEFFIHKKNLREFLPEFDNKNSPVPGTWPDLTFGGIVSESTFKK